MVGMDEKRWSVGRASNGGNSATRENWGTKRRMSARRIWENVDLDVVKGRMNKRRRKDEKEVSSQEEDVRWALDEDSRRNDSGEGGSIENYH